MNGRLKMNGRVIFGTSLAVLLAATAVTADLSDGLIGYWRMNDAGELALQDSSGNGHNCALISGVEFGGGIDDTALCLDNQEYINCGGAAALQPTEAVSVSVWLDTIPGATHIGIVTNTAYDGSGGGYKLSFEEKDVPALSFIVREGADNSGYAAFPRPANSGWHHVVGTYDGEYVRIYYNGVEMDDTPYTLFDASGDDLYLGTDSLEPGPRAYGGCMDEVRIYDRALTPSEIVQLAEEFDPVCGDGTVEDDEECDDGNTRDGDGCTADCREEFCGDGVLNDLLNESCDDGNTMDGDGCPATCEVVFGRCCFDNGQCGTHLPEAACEARGGVYGEEGSWCSSLSAPAVSRIGVALLGVVILALGGNALRKRKVAA